MITINRKKNKKIQQRQFNILETIASRENVLTTELAEKFSVSIATITRDLQELERSGLILRIHGGATSIQGGGYESPFLTRMELQIAEKKRIAQAASKLIREGDSLILDVGTTNHELAIQLRNRTKITVITTSVMINEALAVQPSIDLYLLGGRYRRSEFSMTGHIAENNLRNFYANYAFLGSAGIDLTHGFTDYSYEQTGIKQVIINQAETKIVLADHTKFDKVLLSWFCNLDKIDKIITGIELSDEVYERYKDYIEIMRV